MRISLISSFTQQKLDSLGKVCCVNAACFNLKEVFSTSARLLYSLLCSGRTAFESSIEIKRHQGDLIPIRMLRHHKSEMKMESWPGATNFRTLKLLILVAHFWPQLDLVDLL